MRCYLLFRPCVKKITFLSLIVIRGSRSNSTDAFPSGRSLYDRQLLPTNVGGTRLGRISRRIARSAPNVMRDRIGARSTGATSGRPSVDEPAVAIRLAKQQCRNRGDPFRVPINTR